MPKPRPPANQSSYMQINPTKMAAGSHELKQIGGLIAPAMEEAKLPVLPLLASEL
ncbi:hypothetical protein MDA_GLEAN10017978 [Myotis davidii]|uniref:Uncharacterized protein n=1 Tax=Myotis davidii TaxID=225400 RepID=L5LEE9_MYODS|nr:hypothetical protein MDA_GLEAN10017978 [Myotis davidii]